jgi:ADP-ribose pyrophosphatase YjhB (NUDIX family)
MDPALNFCSACGAPLAHRIPPGDALVRGCCDACGVIHYRNPRLVVGTLPVWARDGETKVLLCKRAIEPRYGYWTLPAGFMENGESVDEAALRETREEAGAHIELGDLYTMISVPYIHQVHVIYRATLLDLDFAPGDESLDVRLFTEAEIPWDELAFRTIKRSLRHFFKDSPSGVFPVHTESLSVPASVTLSPEALIAAARTPGHDSSSTDPNA